MTENPQWLAEVEYMFFLPTVLKVPDLLKIFTWALLHVHLQKAKIIIGNESGITCKIEIVVDKQLTL